MALLFKGAESYMQFWIKASWGTIVWSCMKFGPVVQEEMSFKDISYLELWQLLCSVDLIHLCNIGRRHHEERSCVIILNLDQRFRRKCRLSIFLIWSSGCPFCTAERNHLCNFGRGYQEEQFCDFFLNFDQWFRRRCHFKRFLIWSSGNPPVQWIKTIYAILKEGIMGKFHVKLYEIRTLWFRRRCVYIIEILWPWHSYLNLSIQLIIFSIVHIAKQS